MAAVANNRSGLTGADRLTHWEAVGVAAALCLVSVLALVVLARPHVTVLDGRLSVRNPVRKYDLALAEAGSLEPGFLGFPTLRLRDGRAIRLMGLGESSRDTMEGGGEDALVLRAVMAENPHVSRTDRGPQLSKAWAVMDRSLALLLMGWLSYAALMLLLP